MNWFNKGISQVEKELQTDIKTGLTDEQVKATGRDWSCRYNDRKIQRLTERDGQKG